MNSMELCFRLLGAESEKAVGAIVDSDPNLANPANWSPIDDRDTNFNTVTNQASTGGKALTELCVNMVDAVLLKHAHLKGIDPKGPDAPQSVIAAVRELVQMPGMPSGILAEVDAPKYLQDFAGKNLVIGVTGGTRVEEPPCFTFVDRGEGQHPQDFEDTFLSLSKGNKSDIPFVQGKYNMGSSGVLSYCGERWYKLIVSRKYDGKGDWGWTLVRRRPGGGMPVADFFKYAGAIPTFTASRLYPLAKDDKPDDAVYIETGSVIKLYDYQMETSPSFRAIRESLNENLISTVLPIRLMDYRYRAEPRRGGRRALGIDERALNGMSYMLLRREDTDDSNDSIFRSEMHVGEVDHPKFGHISVNAIKLGAAVPSWLKAPRTTARVFHAVNGQVQFKENRGYLSQTCKLPGLKDAVVLIVDASNLSEAASNDVWKGDRENIRATAAGQQYREEVTKIITSSDELKALQRQLADEQIKAVANEEQINLFQSLAEDPSIAQLLPGGSSVKIKRIPRRDPPPDWNEGKYSPTYLEVAAKAIARNGADIEPGGKRLVEFRTDAENDYLIRPGNRGRMIVPDYIVSKFSVSRSLRDGRLRVTFEAMPDGIPVGETFSFNVSLQDDAMPMPVKASVSLNVVEARKSKKSGRKNPKQDSSGQEEPALAPPDTQWLTEDGREIDGEASELWPEGFTGQSGGEVRELDEEQRLYLINYDNDHFRRVLLESRTEADRKVVTEQYRMGMLVQMMGFEDAYRRMDDPQRRDNMGDLDELRRLVAQASATVVMPLVKTLPAIVNPSMVADPDD